MTPSDAAVSRRRLRELGRAVGAVCSVPTCTRRCVSTRPGHPWVPGWCLTHRPDEVAIERAMAGDPVRLYRHERVEAVRRLAARGLADRQVAELLGVTRRTVERDRTEYGIPTQVPTSILGKATRKIRVAARDAHDGDEVEAVAC